MQCVYKFSSQPSIIHPHPKTGYREKINKKIISVLFWGTLFIHLPPLYYDLTAKIDMQSKYASERFYVSNKKVLYINEKNFRRLNSQSQVRQFCGQWVTRIPHSRHNDSESLRPISRFSAL